MIAQSLTVLDHHLQSKGLKTVKTWTDDKWWFGLIICQVS